MVSKDRQLQRWNRLVQPNFESLNCAICGYSGDNKEFKKFYAEDIFCAGTLIRHECPFCGLIFGDLRVLAMTDSELADDHQDTYSYFTEGDRRHMLKDIFNSIGILKQKELKYLDYACGDGKMVEVLKHEGYDITGYDKYIKAFNVLSNIDGLKFDIIYAVNFIEHLINPLYQIADILTHVKHNGYLVFISDCIDRYAIEFTHFHTFYFTGDSFNILCKKLELKIVHNDTKGDYRIIILTRT
jgi:SAM-dependent methyltransferase